MNVPSALEASTVPQHDNVLLNATDVSTPFS